MPDVLLVLAESKLAKMSELISSDHGGVRFARYDDPSVSPSHERCELAVHRGGYDMLMRTSCPAAALRWQLLQQLAGRQALLEPLERVVRFADRVDVCNQLAQLAPAVQQPRFAVLDGQTRDAILAAAADLAYPLICKPLAACGESGHTLAIVLREEGLSELLSGSVSALRPPLLAQEFVPHSDTVLKGYRVGDLVHFRLKTSLPNLTATSEGPAVVYFDSQQPLDDDGRMLVAGPASTRDDRGQQCSGNVTCGGTIESSPSPSEALLARKDEVSSILETIASHMGVELLGIDVLLAPDGRCLVVDANHFSGTPQSVPGFAGALARLAEAKLASRPMG